jgi:hypothetical protein
MNIGHDGHFPLLADLPQGAEVATVKVHDPCVEAVGVQIVVEDQVEDPGAPVAAPPEEERAALPDAISPSPAKVRHEAAP